ncbi:hypothetical protein ES703_48775 [subsurface metagenome]
MNFIAQYAAAHVKGFAARVPPQYALFLPAVTPAPQTLITSARPPIAAAEGYPCPTIFPNTEISGLTP